MRAVNRSLMLIRPKQPYQDWANRVAHAYESLEDLRASGRTLLVPPSACNDPEQFLRENHRRIFETELEAWVAARNRWPEPLDYDTFLSWFDVEFYGPVLDAVDGPLLHET